MGTIYLLQQLDTGFFVITIFNIIYIIKQFMVQQSNQYFQLLNLNCLMNSCQIKCISHYFYTMIPKLYTFVHKHSPLTLVRIKQFVQTMSINQYSNQDIIEKLSVHVLAYTGILVKILHQFAFGPCSITTCTSECKVHL